MAKIVFAAGTSHTPMLLAADEILPRFAETDQNMKHRDKEGRPVTYGDLLEKADPKLAHLVAPENLVARQNVARAAAHRLRQAVGAAALDTLIVFGDDQNESYLEDCRPTFAIYHGDTIRNGNAQHRTYANLPDWYVRNRAGFFEPLEPRDYPIDAMLARHLIEALSASEFDVAASKSLRAGEGEGHAMAYVHRHVMDANAPIPIVPVFLNTYFPPNQPSPRRCYKLGRAVRWAVEAYPGDARVGVLASGGLSHFLVDEEFDRAILKALADKDRAFLQTLPRNKLHAGSSEILNWVALAGAAEGIDLDWFEYVPGYRTPAGTGTGMSFATWGRAYSCKSRPSSSSWPAGNKVPGFGAELAGSLAAPRASTSTGFLAATVGWRDRASAWYAAADLAKAPASAARGRFRRIHGGRAAPSLPAET